MAEYQFSVIVPYSPKTDEAILDATDALGDAGCTDASICGHPDGMELQFDREGQSLQEAIASAIRDVERAGFPVSRVELARDVIPV